MSEEEQNLGVFDIVNAISKNKHDYFRDDATSTKADKAYIPFLVNKSLSYHIDTVLYANEMNIRGNLDASLQHDYLINTVRPRDRRSGKWSKSFSDKDTEAVMEYYRCNYNRAKEFLTVLTKDQLSVIHDRTFKGGRVNDNKHNRDGRG